MEAALDVMCLIENSDQKKIIHDFVERESRPLLAGQVAEAHRETFGILDNLSSVEGSQLVGENGLALSWFLGGGDWFTEAETILADLAAAGIDRASALLWVDGHVELVYTVSGTGRVDIFADIEIEQLEQKIGRAVDDGNGGFSFLLDILNH